MRGSLQKIARRAGQDDAARLQHVAMVRDLSARCAFCSTMKIVTPSPVDRLDQLQHAIDEERRQAHGRLVHDDDARAAHQRARHRDHLLLAAGQRAGRAGWRRSARRGNSVSMRS